MTTTATSTDLPTFGLVRIEADPDGGAFGGCLGQHDLDVLDDMTSDQLRALAQSAVQAAEWLESVR